MFESPLSVATREYEIVRNRAGADFFLALSPYVQTLLAKRQIRKVIHGLEKEVTEAAERTRNEQVELIGDAKAIREELARRAPEIDNSNMERPENPLAPTWIEYDRDSFLRFDEIAAEPVEIRYSPLPGAGDPEFPLSRLLGILRGRLSAAEHGENPNDPRIRDDLDDLGRQIGNLGRRNEHSLRGYQQDERRLVGLAFARLATFGSDLNPEPTLIESDEDVGRLLDKAIREWGDPRATVRGVVSGERLDDVRQRSAERIEEALKGEVERVHQELLRRLSPFPFWQPTANAMGTFVAGVAATVVAALILQYGFGIG